MLNISRKQTQLTSSPDDHHPSAPGLLETTVPTRVAFFSFLQPEGKQKLRKHFSSFESSVLFSQNFYALFNRWREFTVFLKSMTFNNCQIYNAKAIDFFYPLQFYGRGSAEVLPDPSNLCFTEWLFEHSEPLKFKSDKLPTGLWKTIYLTNFWSGQF